MSGAPLCPTVAVGSSAGGVKVLQELFAALPPDLGAAYVVISHLDPDHPSELAQILSRRTTMPVVEVEEVMPLEANRVYVIAPNRRLVIANGEIATRPFDEPRARRAPIDLFFRSLAEQHGDGFAVVLSGSGSDGSIGVRAMKEAGGVILVQDPSEAEYDSMPRSAIATGCADIVRPITELARSLVDLLQHKLRLIEQKEPEAAESIIPRILALLTTRTGHDFTNYKRSTILRRLTRRMQLNRLERMEDYLAFLRENPEETQALFGDLLISVTTFFRDPGAFKTLSDHVISSLVARQTNDAPLRVWIAGCATGEEVYSIAILLVEEATKRDVRPEMQIFATDIDAAALATAREGRYPSAIEADVNEERLRRFFAREGDNYRIRKDVRDLVVFASHSLLRDPPFSRLDLVSCRNLLIYLDREVQKQVVTMLHYALNPGGFLFLGSAETPDAAPGLFRVVDRTTRIYEAVERMPKPRVAPAPTLVSSFATPPRTIEPRRPQRAPAAGAAHRRALEELAAPSVLVGAGGQVINVSETAGRFLLHPEGPLSSDITQLVRPELRLEVSKGVHLAFDAAEPSLSWPIAVQFNGTPRRVTVQVRPLKRGDTVAEAVVLFIEGGPVEATPDLASLTATGAPADTVVGKLQDELHLAREELRVSRQEYESTNEELRAARNSVPPSVTAIRFSRSALACDTLSTLSFNSALSV